MSGPIIGRRLGRRQNNSEIGTTESIHAAGDPAQKRANTYDNSYARNYGIRTMNQVTNGVFNSTYISFSGFNFSVEIRLMFQLFA